MNADRQDHQARAHTLRSRADESFERGNLQEAAILYEEAADLFERADDAQGLARTRQSQGFLALWVGDLEAAATFYNQAADLFERVQDRIGLAHIRLAQGNLALHRDDLDRAEALYDQAADLFERMQDRDGLAHTRLAQGDLAFHRGDLNAARRLYEQAADLFEQVQDRHGLAHTQWAQAEVACRRGDLDPAAALYGRAADLYEQEQDRQGLANTRRGQGALASHRGALGLAEAFYGEAAELYERVQDRLGLTNIRLLQGELARDNGRLDQAAGLYEEAARLLEQRSDLGGLANTRRAQGDLAYQRGNVDAAEAFYKSAADLFEQTQDPLGLANTLRRLGDLACARDDLPGAGRLYAMALGHISVGRMPVYPSTATPILESWAGLHLTANRPYAAWLRARGALRLCDDLVALQPSATDRDLYRRSAANATAIAVASALQLAATAAKEHNAATSRFWRLQAWRVAERHRSAVLLSLFSAGTALRETHLRPEEEADPALLRLLARLAEVEAELRRLLATLGTDEQGPTDRAATFGMNATPPGSADPRASRGLAALATQADQRMSLDSERQQLQRELRARNQRLGTAAGDLEPPFERLLAILKAEQAGMVSYVLLPDETFAALVLRPDGNVHHVALKRTKDDAVFEALVKDGQHRFQTPWERWNARERRAFERLGQDLWAPLETSGALTGLDHLYVVPAGELRLMPFAALSWVEHEMNDRVRRRHVVKERALTVLHAGGTLAHIAEAAARAQAQPADLASVIDPARAHSPVLPQAVQAMLQALAPQVPLEGAVDRDAFIHAVNAAGGLLYFGHAAFGGVMLDDGLFGAEDVLRHLDLRGPALLGACLLGLEHAMYGLAGASTVSALHLVGCPTVMGALWEVPAEETAILLDRVRRAGGAGPDGWAEALRQAQLALRAEGASPTAWAAFTLYGSPFA